MSTVTLDGKTATVVQIQGTLVKAALGGWKLKVSNPSALNGVKLPIPVAILIPSK